MSNDLIYMKRALELAEIAFKMGEVPVGAVVVKRSTGEIVGEGFNRRETAKSPLAHAEIEAISTASKKLGGWRLVDCDLYVTLEPCPMCSGAIINSRVERVFFGAFDKKAGCCGSVVDLFSMPFNHFPEIHGGIMQDECSKILSDFFAKLRLSPKKKWVKPNQNDN